MTWWRQSRDASGMTIVGRLELIDGNCLTNMANCGYDEDGCALYLAISHHRKRIRSILRRLKRCVKCHGTGVGHEIECVKIGDIIRRQAARIAELEDDNYYQEESLRIIYLVSTGEDMSPGRTGAVAGKAIERMQRDKARIAELEDKLRWRDCKSEPPTKGGVYIVKQTEDGQPWFDIFMVDIGWENAWNGGPVPHSWRPIE